MENKLNANKYYIPSAVDREQTAKEGLETFLADAQLIVS